MRLHATAYLEGKGEPKSIFVDIDGESTAKLYVELEDEEPLFVIKTSELLDLCAAVVAVIQARRPRGSSH